MNTIHSKTRPVHYKYMIRFFHMSCLTTLHFAWLFRISPSKINIRYNLTSAYLHNGFHCLFFVYLISVFVLVFVISLSIFVILISFSVFLLLISFSIFVYFYLSPFFFVCNALVYFHVYERKIDLWPEATDAHETRPPQRFGHTDATLFFTEKGLKLCDSKWDNFC